MEKMLLADIAAAIGCKCQNKDVEISHISSDSRDLPQGCLFIALKGERFDGHDYVAAAMQKGACAAVVMQDGEWPQENILKVADTRMAYLKIAGLYRKQRGVKVAAITGSVGKTTTKEMVACVVAARYKTLKTQANLNNEIGLSQTVLGLTATHEAAVLEMGMDGPGQIAPLAVCAAPDVGIVTNIGVSHLESLGSRENIMKEKLDILKGMGAGSTLVLNLDDDMLAKAQVNGVKTITYGINSAQAMVKAVGIRCFSTHTTFEIRYNGRRYDVMLPTMGEHNVYNALAAFCTGIALDIEPHRAIAALRDYKPSGMRQKVVTHCGFTVVEDCYNASPDSMQAALKTLGGLSVGTGRRIAVLSDMLELGGLQEQAHFDCGAMAAKSGIDMLFCTGELSAGYVQGAKSNGFENAYHFADKEELFGALKGTLQEEDIVWVKASRSMHMEEVLEMIYKNNF